MSSVQTSSTPALKITVTAEREIAYESADHLVPWGTGRGNFTNQRFNDKLYKLWPVGTFLKVLDMGCAGGGFVRNCLDDGCIAMGLEGSDYSKRLRRAEWRTIPEYLFTCDITRNFDITFEFAGQAPEQAKFEVITSWEVMEHIAEPDIATVAANVKKHLAPGGLWIMSVDSKDDIVKGVNLHQTVQPKSWWINKFAQLGLTYFPEYVKYFNTQWIRGPKYGYSYTSFHLVVAADPSKVPPLLRNDKWQRRGALRWIYDRWRGSTPQKFLSGDF